MSKRSRQKRSSASNKKQTTVSEADEQSDEEEEADSEPLPVRHRSRPTRQRIETDPADAEEQIEESGQDDGPQVIDDAHQTVDTDKFHQSVSKVPSSTPRIERSQGISTQATARTLVDLSAIAMDALSQQNLVPPSDDEDVEGDAGEDIPASPPVMREHPVVDQVKERRRLGLRSANRPLNGFKTPSPLYGSDEEYMPARSFERSRPIRKGEVFYQATANDPNNDLQSARRLSSNLLAKNVSSSSSRDAFNSNCFGSAYIISASLYVYIILLAYGSLSFYKSELIAEGI
jgi:hypothetical protein